MDIAARSWVTKMWSQHGVLASLPTRHAQCMLGEGSIVFRVARSRQSEHTVHLSTHVMDIEYGVHVSIYVYRMFDVCVCLCYRNKACMYQFTFTRIFPGRYILLCWLPAVCVEVHSVHVASAPAILM